VTKRETLLSCALIVGALTQAASANIYAFDWTRPSQAIIDANSTGPYSYQVGDVHVGDLAGQINAISATFNTSTNRLTFSLNIGDPVIAGQALGGFSLVLTDGGQASGPGEWASYFFDASGIAPTLTAYAYNGHPWSPSYEDGSWEPGNQIPDQIFTSLNDVNNVVASLGDVSELDGTRTWSFDIDVTSIVAHNPLYQQPWPWKGAGFTNSIGMLVQTATNVNVTYDENGFPVTVCYSPKTGYFGFDKQPAVPAPGAMALLAIAGLCARQRRRAIV